MTVKIDFPPLHQGQRKIWETPARFKVVAAGRRFGKTRLGVCICLAHALQNRRAWWVAPSYKVADVGWRLLTSLAGQIPGVTINRSEMRIERARGWAQVRSADSEGGLRGEGLDQIVIDETAHIRGFMDIWQQQLRPALTDRRGEALFISTPKGYNHFYELFKMPDSDDGWAAFQSPTADNPFIDPAEIEAAQRELPALVFRQEYLAEFVQLAGALFRREYFDIVETMPSALIIARHWDLAASTKTLADYSVGAKVGMSLDGDIYVIDVQRGRWEWPALIRVIGETALTDDQQVSQTVETAGVQRGMLDLLMAEPRLAAIPFRGITPIADKITRANPVLARAEQHKVHLLRASWNAAFLDEFCAFPEADHDDQVDAVSGAFQAISMSNRGSGMNGAEQVEDYESPWR